MIDTNRDAVRRRLEALGFAVKPIQEVKGSPRPDLVAQVEGSTMYVEVKTRSEDRVLRAKMESVRIGEQAEILTDLEKHNGLSAEIEHASRQLSSIASAEDYRLLWYRADNGPFVHDAKEQIGATLFGFRVVLATSSTPEERPWYCAYAGHADFFRFQDIDATTVEEDGLITLFMNPFSPRRAAFATNRLARLLGESVFNVEKAIAQGLLFAADGDAPRRCDADLLAHLALKYPEVSFSRFLRHCAGTVMTTIDARQYVSNGAAGSPPIGPEST